MSGKIRYVLGVLIIFSSIFAGFLRAPIVNAAVSPDSPPWDIATSHLYARYIKACLTNTDWYYVDMQGGAGSRGNQGGIKDGVIGPQGAHSFSTGLDLTTSVACNNSMNDFINYIGLPWGNDQEKVNTLCAIAGVHHEKDGYSCTDISPAAGYWWIPPDAGNKFMTLASSTRQVNLATPNTLESYYYYYKLVFRTQCDATEVPTGTAPGSNSVSISQVQSDGSFKPTTYNYNPTAVVRMNTGSPLQLPDRDQNCENYAKKVNEFASKPDMIPLMRAYLEKSGGTLPGGATGGTDSGGTDSSGTSTCAVDGIGWLVCPVMTFLSKTMDGVLEFVANNFLRVNSELLNTTSGTYQAWNAFRGYANVAFVIVFLIIIYSQITNVGISSYGIKRMIPKLIISAILVNLSYFICQIAVDVSNLVGYGVKDVFDAAIKTVTAGRPSGGGIPSWLDTIGPILAVGAGVLLALSLGVLGAAIIAAAMIVIILVARKAFIIILIVLAPLAFVAYLLPNTEQWFKKWWKALSTILLVFPIISLLFYGGKLAASVLNTAGASVDASNTERTALQLTALGVMVLPVFAVLPILKGAMSAAGTLGAKLKGMGDKATGRVSSKAKEGRENSYINRIKQLRSKDRSVRQAMVAGGSYKGRNPVQRARSAIFARANRSRITGNSGDRMAAQGASLADKEFDENVNAAKATFSGKTFEEIKDISHDTGADSATRTAAIQHIMEKGNFSQRNELVKLTTGMNSAQRSSVVNGLMSRGDQAIYGADIGDAITKGQIGSTPADADAKINNFIANNIASKKVKAETMVHDAEATKLIADVVTGGGTYTLKDPSTGSLVSRTLSAAEIGAVRTAATEATRLPATASKASQNFKDEFARL